MKTKLLLAISFVLMVAVIGAGTATATPPSGLTSELLARGAAGNFSIKGENLDLTIKAKDATDLAMVKATLTANGYTGWHKHPGPSVVLVKQGTLTLREPHDGACASHTYGAGQAFVHPEGVHDFVAGSAGAEFFVTYFVPAGAAPLLTDAPVPPGCG
jgi:quercetin dioxygenase-like cupin family protein